MRSPLGIAVLMIVSTATGGIIKDRLDTQSASTASEVRIDALNQRLTEHLADAVSRHQYEEANMALDKRLDDIRQDLRDLKSEVEQIALSRRSGSQVVPGNQ
jgi:hypothetical protein